MLRNALCKKVYRKPNFIGTYSHKTIAHLHCPLTKICSNWCQNKLLSVQVLLSLLFKFVNGKFVRNIECRLTG